MYSFTHTRTHTHAYAHTHMHTHRVYIHFIHTCRKEQFQEELWSISFDLLKDWMSPEIQSKYSTRSQQSQSSDVTDKTATTSVGDDSKLPAEVAAVDDNKSADDKQPQGQQPS